MKEFTVIWVLAILDVGIAVQDVYDVRIHEGADPGTRLTMSSDLQTATEPLGHCFGQLETDVDWIEWRSSRSAFYTTSAMPPTVTKTSDNLIGTLHLLCAGNRMHTFPFKVHVTHRNHHPPSFDKPSYHFDVSIDLSAGAVIGRVSVHDNDPVIYNSERRLSFAKDDEYVKINQDGNLVLKRDSAGLVPYKPRHVQLLAIDYGSPQLFAIVNLTIMPVTVSRVRDARVNIANRQYQLFDWQPPEHGKADKFRLSVKRDEQIIYEEEIESTKNVALTKIKLADIPNSAHLSYQITAIDRIGETPSEWLPISKIDTVIHCEGSCARDGGIPLCYFGSFNRIEQFVDARGPHCLCFPGFIGVDCGEIDQCKSEKTIDVWGGVDWTTVNANTSLRLPCPYNQPTENQFIERRCEWNADAGRAEWAKPMEKDRCTYQTSVLTHLGMMGTFAARASTVSAVNTVITFVRKLLMVPSFSPQTSKYAHFDQKIAEMTALVLDSIVQTNLDNLSGNSSLLKDDTWEVINDFSKALPLPYSLTSPDSGIYMKTIEWRSSAESIDNLVGKKCRIQLPGIDKDQVIRTVCVSNATLFDLLEPKSPVLSIQSDNNDPFVFSRLSILLKLPDKRENYTCVFYDASEQAWSTKGIRRIDVNHHGYVKCEANHLGIFSILPERLFFSSESLLSDLATHMPTVTSFVTLICTILLLFMAAVQKNQSIDCAFLFYLFFVFMIHLIHLLLFLAPQLGEPFTFTTMLHFILQFCVISTAGLLSLVLFSIHSTIISIDSCKLHDSTDSQEDTDDSPCFTRPCHVFSLGILIPALFTITTYYLLNGRDIDASRMFERINWLFIANYLTPTAVLFSISIVYAVWNIYIGSGSKNNRRCSTDRFIVVTPAISASFASLFMMFFICSTLLLFFFRDQSPLVVFLFCIFQFFHVVSAFFFASYLFRLRFLLQRTGPNTVSSTDSLERKRDISRALLDHVGSKSSTSGTVNGDNDYDGGFHDAGFNSRQSAYDDDCTPSLMSASHHDYACSTIGRRRAAEEQQRFLTFNQNIFERTPMVSIV